MRAERKKQYPDGFIVCFFQMPIAVSKMIKNESLEVSSCNICFLWTDSVKVTLRDSKQWQFRKHPNSLCCGLLQWSQSEMTCSQLVDPRSEVEAKQRRQGEKKHTQGLHGKNSISLTSVNIGSILNINTSSCTETEQAVLRRLQPLNGFTIQPTSSISSSTEWIFKRKRFIWLHSILCSIFSFYHME